SRRWRLRRGDGRCRPMLENTTRTRRAVVRHDDQHQRGQHEERRRDGGCLGEHGCGAARAKYRLRSHSAEGAGQIGRLAALQENHDDQKKAQDDVQSGDQVQHVRSEYTNEIANGRLRLCPFLPNELTGCRWQGCARITGWGRSTSKIAKRTQSYSSRNGSKKHKLLTAKSQMR